MLRAREPDRGRGVTLRNVPATTMQQMKFDARTDSNGLRREPKRFTAQGRAPSTRHGQRGRYRRRLPTRGLPCQLRSTISRTAYEQRNQGRPPPCAERDLRLETLSRNERRHPVHIHCYRATRCRDARSAREFGFKWRLHHGVEAYKLRPLAQEGVCGALWPTVGLQDGGFDAVWETSRSWTQRERLAIVHSDSPSIQRLTRSRQAMRVATSGPRDTASVRFAG